MASTEVTKSRDRALLPWRDVAREAVRAPRREWVVALGLPLTAAVITGLVEWALAGADEAGWDQATGSGVIAPVIVFLAFIVLAAMVKAMRASVVVARREISERDATITSLEAKVAELEAQVAAQTASGLERWIVSRLSEADMIARQRDVRADAWYFNEMGDWDTANCNRLAFGDDSHAPLAPDLIDSYRRDPRTGQTDGIYPPHDAAEQDRYYEQRKTWLRDTLDGLRAGTVEPPEPLPEISEDHRKELQEIAAGIDSRLDLERTTVYAPRTGSGRLPVAESFRTHFPKLAKALDEWDRNVDELDEARIVLQGLVAEECQRRSLSDSVLLVFGDAVQRDAESLPWVQTGDDLLMLGHGLSMTELSEGVDVADFKRPYDELFADVREWDEAGALRGARLRVDAMEVGLHEELDRIQALHVIRGRCPLCS
jgi:hypothetical protein